MQKARELRYLQRIMSLCGDFPTSPLTPSESPDFLFEDSGPLGIELTDFVRRLANVSVTGRTVESLHERVANVARARFEAVHDVPLWVTMHWNSRYRLTKRSANTLGAELASLISAALPDEPNGSVVLGNETHGDRPLLEAVPRIHVRRLPAKAAAVWGSIEVGFVSASDSEVQAILDEKEPLVSQYLRRCGCVWLIIIADGIRISSSAELKPDGHVFTTSFERVYFYDGAADSVLRLK